MAVVPKLNRLTRWDKFPGVNDAAWFRFMALWQSFASKIEEAFQEIVDLITSVAAVTAAVANKNAVFVQTSAPTATAVDDLWLDSDDGYKAYRWNGMTWEAVQDVGAAYARLGVNSDGTIKTDKVLTVSMIAEAVTTKTYAFTAGSVNITSGSYTYQEVQSATITTTGEDVEIDAYFEIYVIDNCKYKYRILRDGVQVIDLGPVTVSTADGPPAFFRYVDSPAAGTYKYTLEVGVNDAGDIDVLNRGLSAKEIKR